MFEEHEARKEPEITPQMIEAGAAEILGEIGGSEDVGGYFSARDLAEKVFRAMEIARARS